MLCNGGFWLPAIHYYRFPAMHLKYYLNEFVYRFNRKKYIEQCPPSQLITLALSPWLSHIMDNEAYAAIPRTSIAECRELIKYIIHIGKSGAVRAN